MTPAEIQRELEELEVRLERLRIKYDQYFTGIEKTLPFVARKDVDRRFQILHREQMRNTGIRFRFQTLVQRFTMYQTYWQRIVRQIEEGTFRRDVVRAQRLGQRLDTRKVDEPAGPQELDPAELEELEPEPAAEIPPPAMTAPSLEEPAPTRHRPLAPPLEDTTEPAMTPPIPARDIEEFSIPPRAITPPPRAAAANPSTQQIGPVARPAPLKPAAQQPAAQQPAAQQLAAQQPAAQQPAAQQPAAPTGFVPRGPGTIPPGQPVARPGALVGGRALSSATGSTPPSAPGAPAAPRSFVPPRPPGTDSPVKAPGPGGTVLPRPAQPAAPTAPTAAQPMAPRLSQPPVATRPMQPPQPASAPPPRAAQPSLPPRPSAAPGGGDDPAMKQLYDRYVAARKQTGESADVRFETVARQVKETLPRLAEKYRDADVRLDVAIKDGKAILRPVVTMKKKSEP